MQTALLLTEVARAMKGKDVRAVSRVSHSEYRFHALVAALKRRALFALVVAAATLGATSLAHAQVLVSNIDQRTISRATVGDDERAQGFTTGTSAGGYTLSSIEIDFRTAPGTAADFTATLWSSNASEPDMELHTLVNPGGLTSSAGVKTFTAPANTVLEARTTYFVNLVFAGPSTAPR